MAAETNSRADSGQQAKEKPTLSERLPQLLMAGFIALNCVIMLGGTLLIYKIKIIDKRALITEDSLAGDFDEDRLTRGQTQIRFTFDPFVANLDERPKKLVHATIQLEMLNEDGYVEVVEKTPKARDEIVRILNGKKYTDVETIQGKLFLKDQIMTAMNKILQKGMVKDVYLADFVVQ